MQRCDYGSTATAGLEMSRRSRVGLTGELWTAQRGGAANGRGMRDCEKNANVGVLEPLVAGEWTIV